MPYNLRLRMQVIKNTEYLKLEYQSKAIISKIYKISLLKERLGRIKEFIKKKKCVENKIYDAISDICMLRDIDGKFDDDIVANQINFEFGKKFENVEEDLNLQDNFKFKQRFSVFKPAAANIPHSAFEINGACQHRLQLHNKQEQPRLNLKFVSQQVNHKDLERTHLAREIDRCSECSDETNKNIR